MRGMIGLFVVQVWNDKKGKKRFLNWTSVFAYKIVAVIDKRTVLVEKVWSILHDTVSRGDGNGGTIEEIACHTNYEGWQLDKLELFPEPEKVRREQHEIGEVFEFYKGCPQIVKWRSSMINCHVTATNCLLVTQDYDEDTDTGTVERWEEGVWRTEKFVNGVNVMATNTVESN